MEISYGKFFFEWYWRRVLFSSLTYRGKHVSRRFINLPIVHVTQDKKDKASLLQKYFHWRMLKEDNFF